MRFIVYTGEGEVIVTTPESEVETVKVWFVEGQRNLEEYDREEHDDEAVSFSSKVVLN